MYDFSIGVRSNNFRLPLRESIAKAAEIGCRGIQLQATDGETAAENMDKAARRELLAYVRSLGLEFSALCGDFGGHGFMNPEENPMRIERSKRVMEMALDLGCRIVTTHIGVVPEDSSIRRYAVMHDACERLGAAADDLGCTFAIETGPEPSHILCGFLNSLASHGMGVNLDPANLAMVIGEDIPQAVRNLKRYIVHTHAKDGKMLVKTKPEIIYGAFDESQLETGIQGVQYFLETPLGEGSVPYDAYCAALNEIGYHGYLCIEREVGGNPVGDITLAVNFLRKYCK
ncbi:MAG: sugar phosphate isomerase/epimerase family protein [Clostridiaceae bacterium]|nr:sugar phosphate isomerase/epimerase family protein [Clostridiaceae bacterium]